VIEAFLGPTTTQAPATGRWWTLPIVVTAAQFPAAIRERLRQDTALVERIALEVAQRGIADAVKGTDEAKAVDQSFYKLSWSARPIARGAILENTAPYAAILEYGRRPGRPGPPLSPILGWVERKLVRGGTLPASAAYPVAVAIREHIHRRGTKPRRILAKTVARVGPWFLEASVRELRRKR
jgi:hypothetical protein